MTPAAIALWAERARQVCAADLSDLPSPCVSVCRMDPVSALCEGCFRTLDEIAAWSRMDDASKRDVWQAIAQRVPQHNPPAVTDNSQPRV